MSQEPLSAFHVIGFEDADELLMKSDIMVSIKRALRERGITAQGPAAEALGMNRSEVSLLLGGKVSRFTLDRLIKAHNYLDKDTQIGLVFSTRRVQPAVAPESVLNPRGQSVAPSGLGKTKAAKPASTRSQSDTVPRKTAPKHTK